MIAPEAFILLMCMIAIALGLSLLIVASIYLREGPPMDDYAGIFTTVWGFIMIIFGVLCWVM